MFKKFQRGLLLGVTFLTLLTQTGCFALLVGAAAGAGGLAYIKGTLEKNVDKPVSRVQKASVAAVKDLKLQLINQQVTQHDGRVAAMYPDETKVTIDISALTEKSSVIKIRVGLFGDQEKSEIILNAILRRL